MDFDDMDISYEELYQNLYIPVFREFCCNYDIDFYESYNGDNLSEEMKHQFVRESIANIFYDLRPKFYNYKGEIVTLNHPNYTESEMLEFNYEILSPQAIARNLNDNYLEAEELKLKIKRAERLSNEYRDLFVGGLVIIGFLLVLIVSTIAWRFGDWLNYLLNPLIFIGLTVAYIKIDNSIGNSVFDNCISEREEKEKQL